MKVHQSETFKADEELACQKEVWKGKYVQNLQVEEFGKQMYINDISRLGVILEVIECWPIRLHMIEEV